MKLEFCEQCHRYHEHPALCGMTFMKAIEVSIPTQQELNVRFAKALGWKIIEPGTDSFRNPYEQLANKEHETILASNLPNYFAPENFHLVRAAVGELKAGHQVLFFSYLQEVLGIFDDAGVHFAISKAFLSPIDQVITAYLKVKDQP